MPDENGYRQVLFHELAPEHWVSVNMKGAFDSDMWGALHDWLKRHETRPASADAGTEL